MRMDSVPTRTKKFQQFSRIYTETIIAPTDLVSVEGWLCCKCMYPVARYLCNEQLNAVRPDSVSEDYWASCVNENCVNHHGQGYVQEIPRWVTLE
jgi:hypothetical protein